MIQIENISKSFGDNVLFHEYSLEIKDGEFVMIMGKSGCGKTTLLNMIGALEPVDSGKITVDGIDISDKKKQLDYFREGAGFLFQNFALIDAKTVKANLDIIKNKSRSEISMEEALEKVGLSGKEQMKIYQLSGGEQQRVAIARLMMKKNKVIFADEPTGSLDWDNSIRVMELLTNLKNEYHKTIVMVTHDTRLESYADRVIRL